MLLPDFSSNACFALHIASYVLCSAQFVTYSQNLVRGLLSVCIIQVSGAH